MLDFCIKRKICRNLYRNLNGAQCGSTTWWPGWIAPAATSRSSCVAWRSRSPAESAAAHRRPRTARCTRNCRWMRAAAARSRCACWRCAQGCSGRPGAGGSPWDPLTNLKENTNGKIGRLAGGGSQSTRSALAAPAGRGWRPFPAATPPAASPVGWPAGAGRPGLGRALAKPT